MSDTTPDTIHPHDVEDDRYQRTIIYEIRCNVTGERYVGSTIQTLKLRIRAHVSEAGHDRGPCRSKQIINRGDYKASVIESRPCKTKREALTLEGEWQRRYKATYGDLFINRRVAGVFCKDNPKSYNKNYYADHKAEHNAYSKEYRANHQEEMKVRDKKYYANHKAEHNAYSKEYYANHKEEISAKASRPWTCEWCGTTVQFGNRSRHKRKCKHRSMDDREAAGAADRDARTDGCAQLQPILEYIRHNVIRRAGTGTDA
jgi:hypothetical protein